MSNTNKSVCYKTFTWVPETKSIEPQRNIYYFDIKISDVLTSVYQLLRPSEGKQELLDSMFCLILLLDKDWAKIGPLHSKATLKLSLK